MLVQVHTDKHIEGGERLNHYVTETITGSFDRFADKLSRVDVHLSDENAGKSGSDDKRCLIEAKVDGHNPIAVTSFDATVEKALHTAIDKTASALDTMFDKMKH